MITELANRDAAQQWPPVRIIRGLPDHPVGAIRYPRPELRDRWLKLGVCELLKLRKRGKGAAE